MASQRSATNAIARPSDYFSERLENQSEGSPRNRDTSEQVSVSRSGLMSTQHVSSQHKTRIVDSRRSLTSNEIITKLAGKLGNPDQPGRSHMPIYDSWETSNKQNLRQKKPNKSSLHRKPVSDYRLTNINPQAIEKGPMPWPTPNNLVPSGAEEDTSDLIVVSGGVSTGGDVDHPGRLLEIYDPERNQWRDSIDAPFARNHHVAQFLQDNIYVIGKCESIYLGSHSFRLRRQKRTSFSCPFPDFLIFSDFPFGLTCEQHNFVTLQSTILCFTIKQPPICFEVIAGIPSLQNALSSGFNVFLLCSRLVSS